MSEYDERRPESPAGDDEESSRQRILDATAEIVAEAGYHATTIAKVTERSGLPASSIYWFFKDKDELVAEVVRRSIAEWTASQPPWEVLDSALSAREALVAVLDQTLERMVQGPAFLKIGLLLTLEQYERPPSARALWVELRGQTEAALTELMAGYLGPVRTDGSPELAGDLARVLIAAADGLFLASQIDVDWAPADVVPLMVRALLASTDLEE
ncbi:TetR/AcrR family transcriptional regulator [Nocardioides ferulae]|uniref:TetR/AcrR family transcriptional regulator n=1 Tax=Nocardioides ferulae TaxID=2340821 RepID=UPI000EB19185|nr:TetR/AcrR family transcriptional regulator [Nocardioides ferulae]